MKFLLYIVFFLFSTLPHFGQEVKITTDKEAYKFDEIIELTFELNAKYDSIDIPELKRFKIVSGPNKSSSVSIQNEIRTERERLTYRLRPLKSGQVKISSPTFYKNGKELKGKSIKIKVDSSNLTDEELKKKEYNEFIEDAIKPKGTTRIMLHENKGYIEIFGEMGWEFYRRLTLEEIKQLQKVN